MVYLVVQYLNIWYFHHQCIIMCNKIICYVDYNFEFVELEESGDPVYDFDTNKFCESLDKKQSGNKFIFCIFCHSNQMH